MWRRVGTTVVARPDPSVEETSIWIHIDVESICGSRGGPDPEENL
jgi:hypothetical protein